MLALSVLLFLFLAALAAAAAGCEATQPSIPDRCEAVPDVAITFYGSPDNDPPGDAISYTCDESRGPQAGGVGTYDDPLSFATAPGEFEQCEVIYLPYLRKYLRMDDYCEQCTDEFSSGKLHIDIWTGDSSDGGEAQVRCEERLTPQRNKVVIRNPRRNFAVNSGDLWDGYTCHVRNTYPSDRGKRC